MGGWAVAQGPIMITTITLDRLIKRGYVPMLDYYLKVAPQLNEPLYARPVRKVCEAHWWTLVRQPLSRLAADHAIPFNLQRFYY